MEKQSFNFLKKLIETPSPSGFETSGQQLNANEMGKYADNVTSDSMGNVIGCINSKSNFKVVLAGHCDEVGYMIKYIDNDGFLRVGTIGAPRLCCAAGSKVNIQTSGGSVDGVMIRKGDAKLKAEKKTDINDFWIDIGASNKADAEHLVSIGDPVTIDASLFMLANNKISARAFDDRIGVFIILETMKRLKKENVNVGVYGTSTVQEETGGRGAQLVGYNINPDISIVIDVTNASDSPEMNEETMGCVTLGGGPVLLKGCNINPTIGELLVKLATDNKIPFQMQAAPMPTWTDADPLQRMHGGSATALVKIPVRYMHAPTEIVSMDDVENSIKLLVLFLESIDNNINLNPLSI